MLLSKTPVRISFGGGGTDVEPYSSDHGGFVVNATINKYFRSILNSREDNAIRIYSSDSFTSYEYKKIEKINQENKINDLINAIFYYLKPDLGMDIFLHGEAPKRAGLGASASLCTSLIAGVLKLSDKKFFLNDIAEKAYIIETEILKNPGGRQDQYAAVHGGLNEIEFLGADKVKVNPLKISESFKQKLEKNLILFYTGKPHVSGNLVGKQVDTYLMNKEKARQSLDALKIIAFQIRDALISEDFETFGKLLTQDWKEKTKFNPLITTDYMKKLNELVMKRGGLGGRVCGAGGGGSMIWLVDPKKKDKVISVLNNQSGKIIDFKFVEKGLILETI
ncbi:MAG: GHMP family kinase ATP-binding protein [Promethearchaeota archaeon]